MTSPPTEPLPTGPPALAVRRLALEAALFAAAGAVAVAAVRLGLGARGLGWAATVLLAAGLGAGGGLVERIVRRRRLDADTAGIAALGLGLVVCGAALVQGAYGRGLAEGSLDRAHRAAAAELRELLSCGGAFVLATLAAPAAATVAWRREGRGLGSILRRLAAPACLVVLVFLAVELRRAASTAYPPAQRVPLRAGGAVAVALLVPLWACGPALLWALADRLERRPGGP